MCIVSGYAEPFLVRANRARAIADYINVVYACYDNLLHAHTPIPIANPKGAKRVGKFMELNAYFSSSIPKPSAASGPGKEAWNPRPIPTAFCRVLVGNGCQVQLSPIPFQM